MRRLPSLAAAICAFFLVTNALGQDKVLIQGQDENEYRRPIKVKAVGLFGLIETVLSDGTSSFYIAPATTDGMSKSENGIKVEAVMYLDNGTTLDVAKVGATGAMQMEDVTVRAGENPSIFAREMKITYLGIAEPTKVGPTAVDATAISATTGSVILGPTKVLPNGSLCIYVKNVGGGSGDAFSDVELHDSPDGTSGWVITNTWETCDVLVSGAALCKMCTDDALGWIQVKARCATGDTTAEAWLKQVKR